MRKGEDIRICPNCYNSFDMNLPDDRNAWIHGHGCGTETGDANA